MTANSRTKNTSSLTRQLSVAKNKRARLPLLQALSEQLVPSDPSRALEYAVQALALSEELTKRREEAHCLKQIGVCHLALSTLNDAYSHLRKAYTSFDILGDSSDKAETALYLGNVQVERGLYRKGAEQYEDALTLFREEENLEGITHALKALGDLHSRLEDYPKALSYFLQALESAERLDQSYPVGIALSDIAVVYGSLHEYDNAFTYFSKSLELFRSSGAKHLEVRVLANMVSVHVARGNHEVALERALRVLTIYESLDDLHGLATTLVNISNLYERSGRFDTALDSRLKAFNLFDQLDDLHGEGVALVGVGRLHKAMGRSNEAVYVLEEALRIGEKTKDRELECHCHELLSDLLERMGDASRALGHLRSYTALSEQLADQRQHKRIIEMQARFDLEQVKREQEIWRLKSEHLESEMEHKTAELASLTLQLVEKNRFINDVQSGIVQIEEGVPEELQPIARQVRDKIERHIDGSNDWKSFEEQFEKVHRDFVHRLSTYCPSLTPTELRICALIQTGLSTNEISDLLYVSKRTIEAHRYRLRKKLKIDHSKTSLTTFLASI